MGILGKKSVTIRKFFYLYDINQAIEAEFKKFILRPFKKMERK